MRIVAKGEFNGTRAELSAALDAYRAALKAHKATVGQPAPWPVYDVLRDLVGLDDSTWTLAADVPEDADPPPVLTYRDRRAVAYRDTLGAETGSFIKTLGDVLDVLIAQVETMRQAAGAAATAEYADMVAKIADIKQRFPRL